MLLKHITCTPAPGHYMNTMTKTMTKTRTMTKTTTTRPSALGMSDPVMESLGIRRNSNLFSFLEHFSSITFSISFLKLTYLEIGQVYTVVRSATKQMQSKASQCLAQCTSPLQSLIVDSFLKIKKSEGNKKSGKI